MGLTSKAMPKLSKVEQWKPGTISKYDLQVKLYFTHFYCTKHIFLSDFQVPETSPEAKKSPTNTEKYDFSHSDLTDEIFASSC